MPYRTNVTAPQKVKDFFKKLFKKKPGPKGRHRTGGNHWWDQNRPT